MAKGITGSFLSRTNRLIHKFEEIGIVAGLIVVMFIFSMLSPYFFTVSNVGLLLRQASLFGVMAIGMTFVMIAGEIDLSAGSIFGLSMVMMAMALQAGFGIGLAVIVALVSGLAAGFFNGLLTVTLRVPSIIITLGTLSIYRGLVWWITGGWPVENFPKDSAFFQLGRGKLFDVLPLQVILLILIALAATLILQRTVFGRYVYATGSNTKAAIYAGIPVRRIQILVLTLMGLASGIAAVMGVAISQSGDPNAGVGYELSVIAAAIVGRTKLGGGAGTVLGSVLGALIITGVIRNGLVLLGLSSFVQVMVSGAIVVAAVALDTLVIHRRGDRADI